MNCPNCKQPNTSERNYCGACGSPLARYCTLCGFRNLAVDRFCGGCGATLGAAARPAATGAPAYSSGAAGCAGGSEPPREGSDLAELLAAAQEPATPKPEDLSVRVSQDDIDSLFGD
jgi:hypothetical protein